MKIRTFVGISLASVVAIAWGWSIVQAQVNQGGAGTGGGAANDVFGSAGMAGFTAPSACGSLPSPMTYAWISECLTTVDAQAVVKPASTAPVASDPALVVNLSPNHATYTIAGCTVGTSSGACLAASTALNHVQIQNVSSVAATVACAWGASAVLNNSASIQLTAGQSALWGPTTSGFPATALNCIASVASTPLYLEYN